LLASPASRYLESMTDSETLTAILTRLGGIEQRIGNIEERQVKFEERQVKFEERQVKFEESQQRLERKVDGQQAWFQTLAQKVDGLTKSVETMRGEIGEIRDLMAVMHDDQLVARRAIAGVIEDVGKLDERARLLEQRQPGP